MPYPTIEAETIAHLVRRLESVLYRLRSKLDGAVLTEGIRFELFGQADIRPKQVVPWHLHMLTWDWEEHRGIHGS
jgi:hypothetical protein